MKQTSKNNKQNKNQNIPQNPKPKATTRRNNPGCCPAERQSDLCALRTKTVGLCGLLMYI